MGSFQVRTDLALEARESVQDSSGQIRGVKYEEENNKNAGIHVTKVTIETKNGAKAMGKPMGIYITLEVPGLAEPDTGKCQKNWHISCRALCLSWIRRCPCWL